MFNESKLAGKGYITLNVLRVLNIISLLLVAVASWIMLVMTVKTSNFFFFDGVSHFISSSIAIFLIVSELTLFKTYFLKHWPMLSPESGFVFLGMSMIILGFNILGNLNKGATSVNNLGLPMWRVVISSGILSSLMGLFNIIATYVFCNSQLGITGRQVRSHGAEHPPAGKSLSVSSGSFRRQPSMRENLPRYNEEVELPRERRKSRFPFRLPVRNSGIKISAPVPQDPEQFSRFNDRSSPVVPDIQRPPTALHPSNRTPNPPPPPSESNYSSNTRFPHYSVASHLNPF